MARNYIGRILSGGVVVLCIILLFTPSTFGQTKVGGRYQTFTISGTVGEAGVTMQGFPVKAGDPPIMTDDNGVYTVQVRYGWSGTVTPVKPGYTFDPKQRAYTNVTEDKTNEDYTGTLQTFTISGTTGKPGVKLRGLLDDPNSDATGRYSVKVPYGWAGTVTPELEGFRFDPPSKDYTQLTGDKTNENYTARVQTFTITGTADAEGVLMKGFPTEVKTAKDGTYKAEVPYKWSGKVTLLKEGYEFTPESKDYSEVIDNYANEDYIARVFTFEISGSAGMAGVVMQGLLGEPITDADGRYTATVHYGWSGKITPTKAGWSFKPAVLDVAKVTENKAGQDFSASIMKFKVGGTTGVGGVKLTGLPVELTSGPSGTYTTTVDFGWIGTITPEKEGYIFEPASLMIGPVEKDLNKQDFKPKPVTSTIAGNVGMAGVMMQGLPGRVVSGADGSYTAEVPFKWTQIVTPIKDGYTFDPVKREYKDVRESMTAEDYVATIKQYVISGRITSDRGVALADVLILTDKPGVNTMSDINGEFKLSVEHTWTGKITPQKDGCTFTPPQKSVGPVVQNITNQSFIGKMRMVSITDKIELQLDDGKPADPIQGVTITAKPGDIRVTTDARGRYTIQVPYNWTGQLYMSKPGLIFDPCSVLYENLVQDVDTVNPPRPVTDRPPVVDGPPVVQPPVDKTVPTVGDRPATMTGQASAERAKLDRMLANLTTQLENSKSVVERASLQKQIEDIRKQVEALPKPATTDANDIPVVRPDGRITPPVTPPVMPEGIPSNVGPIVSGTFSGTVIDVLTQIAARTSAKVYADMTVKPDPIQPVQITAMPMASALSMILRGSNYAFRRIEKPDEAWQVFRPITNSFNGDDLPQALQDISLAAGVSISKDDTVVGRVYADLQGVPLEVALETVLAGTTYVAKREGNYYVVADRKPEGPAFANISTTRRLRLNYITPTAAKNLLSTAFAPYVQADADPNSHIVTVTAPADLAERLVGELKAIDTRPRHVLLDARIVAMERGDLLNIGVEWGMPAGQLGGFTDSWVRGTPATNGEAIPTGSFPWALSVGLSVDRTFTNALTAALNLLQENNKVDILSSPQIMGRDGKRSRIQAITEEYYALTPPIAQQGGFFYSQTQFETVKSGTTLEIAPLIGDNNDITLEIAVEVSDSIPRGRGSDLPVVTRRTAQNYVTIRDGGTVAVAGLTENRTREKQKKVPWLGDLPLVGAAFRNNDNDKATREIAVFVTAHLVPEGSPTTSHLGTPTPTPSGRIISPATDSFREELRDELSQQ